MRAVANCVSSHSTRFGDQMPTRSPFCDAERKQPGRQHIHFIRKLAAMSSECAAHETPRPVDRETLGGVAQKLRDGCFAQRNLSRATDVREAVFRFDECTFA